MPGSSTIGRFEVSNASYSYVADFDAPFIHGVNCICRALDGLDRLYGDFAYRPRRETKLPPHRLGLRAGYFKRIVRENAKWNKSN